MAEQIFMIALSPTMEEGVILNWKKKEGDVIKEGDALCEVETDKASMDYESSQAGTLLKIVKAEGSGAKVADVIAIIGSPGEDFTSLLPTDKAKVESKAPAKQAVAEKAPVTGPPSHPDAVHSGSASPLARKLASEKGVDLAQVSGSGPGGRVVKRDIENYSPATQSSSPSVALASPLNDDRVPVSRKRAVIAKRLGESLFTAPHFYLTLSASMDPLMNAREKINLTNKEKIGLNSYLIKICASAIVRHQAVNSSWEGDFIQNHSSVDIGLAVAQPDGLITPVIRGAQAKGVRQIDAELKNLIERARANALKPEEYTNATFTISNLGSFGIEEFTAIINPPGVAILALGAVMKVPFVEDDENITIRRQMKMTLSADHRVLDGAVAADFLTDLKNILEDPFRALL